MRKFRSVERICRHESLSQLHKDNVRKAAELLARKTKANSQPNPEALCITKKEPRDAGNSMKKEVA
jgi:hypothetical protein